MKIIYFWAGYSAQLTISRLEGIPFQDFDLILISVFWIYNWIERNTAEATVGLNCIAATLNPLSEYLHIQLAVSVFILIEIQNACPDFWSKTSISGLEFLSGIQSILEITCFQPPVLAPIRCNSSQHFTATDGEKSSATDPRTDKKLLKCVFTGGRVF